MQGNTPDFIFTHFIELFCDVTAGAPRDWELESTVMAIQQNKIDSEEAQPLASSENITRELRMASSV